MTLPRNRTSSQPSQSGSTHSTLSSGKSTRSVILAPSCCRSKAGLHTG
ncbi:hypothetical protein [Paracoccus denitrificans]